ncbi:MAG: hypothetical protein J6W75_05870 [Bacteroidaceae bacterium]|nr:hypothetical protein [Bacteroidaceae bacterium]
MKKIFFLLALVSLIGVSRVNAQSSSAVTLHHENEVTSFSSLEAAVSAAKPNDVIVLSSGSFTLSSLNKRVTIKGAGFNYTTITSNVSVISGTKIEGINFTGQVTGIPSSAYSLEFLKCRLLSFDTEAGNAGGAVYFFNTEIGGDNPRIICRPNVRISCINSVINSPRVLSDESSFNCINCVIHFDAASSSVSGYGSVASYASQLHNAILENCIIRQAAVSNAADYMIPATASATHCVATGSIFTKLSNADENWVNDNKSLALLESGSNYYWTLTSDAKAAYKGTDGTEVGIYGGYLPWSTVTSVPRISKLNVATKAIDGKLNVDISVNGAE